MGTNIVAGKLYCRNAPVDTCSAHASCGCPPNPLHSQGPISCPPHPTHAESLPPDLLGALPTLSADCSRLTQRSHTPTQGQAQDNSTLSLMVSDSETSST